MFNVSLGRSAKDIHLIILLLPSPKCEKKQKPDVLKSVLYSVYPNWRQNLNVYLALICDLNIKYIKNILFQYHKAFSVLYPDIAPCS